MNPSPNPQILVRLTSDGGDAGSEEFGGYILEVDATLTAKIDRLWEMLRDDPSLDHIALHVGGFALPGAHNCRTELDKRDEQRLDELIDRTDGARHVPRRARRWLARCEAYGAAGPLLLVHRHTGPSVQVHDKGDYEQFSSAAIDLLTPRGLRQEQGAAQSQC